MTRLRRAGSGVWLLNGPIPVPAAVEPGLQNSAAGLVSPTRKGFGGRPGGGREGGGGGGRGGGGGGRGAALVAPGLGRPWLAVRLESPDWRALESMYWCFWSGLPWPLLLGGCVTQEPLCDATTRGWVGPAPAPVDGVGDTAPSSPLLSLNLNAWADGLLKLLGCRCHGRALVPGSARPGKLEP